MAIQVQGASGFVAEVDGPTFRALRVTNRPFEALGFYKVHGSTAYTVVTANQPLFSFRWGDATRLAVLSRFEVNVVASAFTTAGLVERQLIVARSFTASDTGGAALTPTGNSQKLRTAMGTSLATDIRVGVLTAGTRTLDAAPLSSVAAWMSAAGTVIQPFRLLDGDGVGEFPLVLAQNEGFVSRFGAAETASTRVSFFTATWAEVAAY